jgi:glycosyltransferase involved in cell wall biosynthesis
MTTPQPMRILFFCGSMDNAGGTERVCAVLANGLCDLHGHAVGIVNLYGGRAPFFPLSERVAGFALFARERAFKFLVPAVIARLRRVLRRFRPDVLIDVDSLLVLYALPAAAGLPVAQIVWEHLSIDFDFGLRARRLARALGARAADAVVALTAADADAWRRLYRPRAAIVGIPNPSPYAAQDDAAPREDRRIVLAAGHLAPQKGFDLLIRAWAAIPAERRTGWRLRIVGSGAEERALGALAAELAVADSVDLPGRRDDMAAEYRRAGLYVLSSRSEGLPMVLIEAAAFAVPAVAFACGAGPRQLVEDGRTGLLVPAGDVAGLAAAIERMLADPGLRAACAAGARQRADAFALPRILAQWEELFARLAAPALPEARP